jgi:dipeptide transport system ATP-binding protein
MTVSVEATNLRRHYSVGQGLFAPKKTLKALDGVSFTLQQGKTLAVVGESGCGKSTLARLVTMIEPPTEGSLKITGVDASGFEPAVVKQLRSKVQIVFQNPYGSLNPRQRIGHILEEPLTVNGRFTPSERTERAMAALERVGLARDYYRRYAHQFSGGQRQRIAIARALMLEPEILVLDEPVSALDLSIQAQILNLLQELQNQLKLSYLFISHDLAVVRHIADDVIVMYLGRVVEQGSREQVFGNPQHPYTNALFSATPSATPLGNRDRIILKGELPSPLNPPSGCAFRTRCPVVQERCLTERPELLSKTDHRVACHFT